MHHLAYSKDGRYLAATLGWKNGIRVFDRSERLHGASQRFPQYGDDAYWADFDATNRLVTTSYDGFVRLYAAGPLRHTDGSGAPRKGERPFSVAFSPDGERVAVGFDGSANVVVLSAGDLRQLYALNVTGVSRRILFLRLLGPGTVANCMPGDSTVIQGW